MVEGPWTEGGTVEPGDKTQETIRRRAYEIWEREGRVGDPLDHWFRAKWELDGLREQERERDERQAPFSELNSGAAEGA
jgi:hypothetical protein